MVKRQQKTGKVVEHSKHSTSPLMPLKLLVLLVLGLKSALTLLKNMNSCRGFGTCRTVQQEICIKNNWPTDLSMQYNFIQFITMKILTSYCNWQHGSRVECIHNCPMPLQAKYVLAGQPLHFSCYPVFVLVLLHVHVKTENRQQIYVEIRSGNHSGIFKGNPQMALLFTAMG